MRADASADVGGSAPQDLDPADLEQLARAHLDPAQMRGVKTPLEAPAKRAPNGIRLLVDLLLHVMGVIAFVHGLALEIQRQRYFHGRATRER